MHNQAENLGLNQHIHSFMQYLKHSVSECVFIKENKKRNNAKMSIFCRFKNKSTPSC